MVNNNNKKTRYLKTKYDKIIISLEIIYIGMKSLRVVFNVYLSGRARALCCLLGHFFVVVFVNAHDFRFLLLQMCFSFVVSPSNWHTYKVGIFLFEVGL